MVLIGSRLCIDRFEARLTDSAGRGVLSPYYHPSQRHTRQAFEVWQKERWNMGEPAVQLLPLPEPPGFQMETQFKPKAESVRGVVPSGYLSGTQARAACERAGKRLCTEEEWERACRGEGDTQFPYGDEYRAGACNVAVGVHPAALLHGHASKGHLDPRLNQFLYRGRSLLHRTGAESQCKSRWGDDAVYDMVGNLDEWVEDESGVFRGGFYARHSLVGCDARISSHPVEYYDYSLGVRCCQAATH